MSSPSAPRSNANSTKQLLDELDALMQRMLELPVSDPEEAVPPQPALNPSHSNGLAQPPVLTEPFRTPPREDPAAPRFQAPHGAPAFVPIPTDEAAPNVPDRYDIEDDPPDAAPPKRTRRQDKAPQPKRPVYKPMAPLPSAITLSEPHGAEGGPWPLLWMNSAFDCGTYVLGPAGRWLRDETGRTCLGWCGILLLATAAGWGLYKLLG